MWDNSPNEKDLFVVLDMENLVYTFKIYNNHIEEDGASCILLGTTKVHFKRFVDTSSFV